ncbi:MAG: hypothetical protein MI919_10320 [Holophagales bacterium]|nr:hypothetical protein [Holophagales bacterium]
MLHDLAAHPGLTIGLLASSFISFFVGVRHLEPRISASAVLGVAALLRLLLLPLPPTLSDDTLRYVWDGRVVAAGENPYRLAPESEALERLRDDLWQRMPHKEVATVYPPLALLAFAAATLAPDPLVGVKIVLCLAELLGCALLVRLAHCLGAPPGRAAWYAWNPLAVLEVAGQGHVDGLMAACGIAAVLALGRRPDRTGLAGALAALGGLAKLVPFAAVPIWARGSRRPALFLAAALLVTTVGLLPVAWTTGMPPGLVTYGVRWEFNGPLYEPVWRMIRALDPVDSIKAGLEHVEEASGDPELLRWAYPYVYPQFLAKLLLAAGFGVAFLLLLLRPRPPVVAAEHLFGAVLLCSATVYPWYVLWVLPWAALRRSRPWLLLSATVTLSYLPKHSGSVELFPWIWAVIWLPVLVLLVVDSWSSWSND